MARKRSGNGGKGKPSFLTVMRGIHKYSKRLASGERRWYYKVSREKGAPVFWESDGAPEPEPFSEAFQAAHSKAKAAWLAMRAGRPAPGTVDALVQDFRADMITRGLPAKTRRDYEPSLSAISAEFGPDAAAIFTEPSMRREIKAWHQGFAKTPRRADYHLGTLVTLLNFAIDQGELSGHVAGKIARLHEADRSDVIWEPDELQALLAVMTPHQVWAIRLAALTGYRRGDLVSIPATAEKDGELIWATSKSNQKVDYCTPITSEIRALLDEIEAERVKLKAKPTTLLFNQRGKPWTADGLSTVFMRARDEVFGKKYGKRFNDLRGTAATRYALAGFAAGDIAEFMGWNEENVKHIIKRYVGRKALVQNRVVRLNANRSGAHL